MLRRFRCITYTRFIRGVCISIIVLGCLYNGRVLATGLGTFEDAPLPSKEDFVLMVKDQFYPYITEFLGYAVPITVTALLIRSSLK